MNTDKRRFKKLSIRDLSKADLIRCIESSPLFLGMFTQDVIASLILASNIQEIHTIREKLDALKEEEKKTRGLKKLIPLRRKMNKLATRGNKLIDQSKELQERFPEIAGEKSC